MKLNFKSLLLAVVLVPAFAQAEFEWGKGAIGLGVANINIEVRNTENSLKENAPFQLLGVEGRILANEGNHRLDGTAGVFGTTSGNLEKSSAINDFHFLKNRPILLSGRLGYKYQLLPHFWLGPGVGVSMPADLLFMVRQMFIGSLILEASMDAELDLGESVSLLVRSGLGRQGITLDHTFVATQYTMASVLYKF